MSSPSVFEWVFGHTIGKKQCHFCHQWFPPEEIEEHIRATADHKTSYFRQSWHKHERTKEEFMSELDNLLEEKVPDLTDTQHIKLREAIKKIFLELVEETDEDDVRDKENELRNINREYKGNAEGLNNVLQNIVANSHYRAGRKWLRTHITERIKDL